ncbi:CatB-related O-acetyltransferase [Bacillus sp. B-jedd]|uniref:CatB-related O-acetyltransferase n=1 Tax=Bacillus sp. B-jedd TaxID=1476857 RepID=UPI0005156C09|nr:CatB-related O-acetyltransferase [Bacillus sp. B-jedd]CEG29109.1 acetyltransferase, CYSE/LACA/LPXA/NODL family [Bacillus sp. B-jedd]
MKISYYISKFIKKSYLPAIKNSSIDKKSRVCNGSHILDVNLDKYSYIGNFCTVVNCDIGKFCSIADNCIIGGASHPIEWVSTSPVFHEGKNILGKNFSNHHFKTSKKTIIGNDVWIGNNCLIKSGVIISDGAIIGMGSVVTKDIGPYEIWGGTPARLIRKRFNDETIKLLLEKQWWEWKEIDIQNKAKYFNEIETFLKKEGEYI